MVEQLPRRDAVERWLNERAPGFRRARVVGLQRFDGGASNLTCRVDLEGGGAVVLRMQRERGIFEPYDVLREALVLRRLAKSPVPVPGVIAEEADPAALGAPFVLLEWVDAPHMGEAGPEADFGAFVRTVAAIHELDWRAAGFDEPWTAPDAAAASRREIESVSARMPAFGIGDDPVLAGARDRLLENIPLDGELRLCQGDINVFNYLFRQRRVVAVVDWEQARIGDARSDIGQLLALAHLKGAPWGPAESQLFALAYAEAAGHRLRGLAYFRAFWLWQLAVIHHGWVSFNGTQPWYRREAVMELLARGLEEVVDVRLHPPPHVDMSARHKYAVVWYTESAKQPEKKVGHWWNRWVGARLDQLHRAYAQVPAPSDVSLDLTVVRAR